MKARRYYRVLAAILVVGMLASAAYAVPERSPKQNFGPRKKKITVERLKEEYGKPFFHIQWEEARCETVGLGKHKNLVKICFDEDIAFKIDDYLGIYYFAWGKFLARVIKGGSPNAELPKLLP
jgi:hypothetical protein